MNTIDLKDLRDLRDLKLIGPFKMEYHFENMDSWDHLHIMVFIVFYVIIGPIIFIDMMVHLLRMDYLILTMTWVLI